MQPKPRLTLTASEYETILRCDFSTFLERSFFELNAQTPFLPNWHIDVMAAKLENCRLGRCRRLIINLPPRYLKSHCASIAFTAWLLGHNPALNIINVSYGQDLADKLARDARAVIMSDWYQALFPTRLSWRRQAAQDFQTTAGGSRLACSVGGALTGRGADVLILDDPLKPDEALSAAVRRRCNDWYDTTLYTRLNDKAKGVIILVMQRLHEDDLVGHVRAQGGWDVLSFPAIAERDEIFAIRTVWGARRYRRRVGELLHPERESSDTLEGLRRTLGEYHFAGQYQQTPVPEGGGMVKREWFKVYEDEQLPRPFEQVVQSWDTANKESELCDYSVCTTWGVQDRRKYLLNVFRKRLNFPELKRAVREQADLHRATVVLIEDKASGTQLIHELAYEGLSTVKGMIPDQNKPMRLNAQTGTIENGFVYLPQAAHWLEAYLHELTTFPKSTYDDQVDSTSQALAWIKQGEMAPTPGLLAYLAQAARGEGLAPFGRKLCLVCGAPIPLGEPYIEEGFGGRVFHQRCYRR